MKRNANLMLLVALATGAAAASPGIHQLESDAHRGLPVRGEVREPNVRQ